MRLPSRNLSAVSSLPDIACLPTLMSCGEENVNEVHAEVVFSRLLQNIELS